MRKLTALLGAVLIATVASACDLHNWFQSPSPTPEASANATPMGPEFSPPSLPIESKPPANMPSPTIEIPPPI